MKISTSLPIIFSILCVLARPILSKLSCKQMASAFPGFSCVRSEALGSGARGTTYLVKSEGHLYVLKSQVNDSKSQRELETLQKMKGAKYVVQLIDWKKVDNALLMVISCGHRGSLNNYLANNMDSLSNKELVRLFLKIVEGVQEIHRRGFVHADLKLDNVVVDLQGNPLIIDFDLATQMGESRGGRGTMNYMPPEVIRSFQTGDKVTFTGQVDLYSLGVIFYLMVFKEKPYYLVSLNYELLMRSSIKFKKHSPVCVYEFSLMAVVPPSARKTYGESLQFLRALALDFLELSEHPRDYSMLEYADKKERNFVLSPAGSSSNYYLIISVIVILCLFILIYLVKLLRDNKNAEEEGSLIQDPNHFEDKISVN